MHGCRGPDARQHGHGRGPLPGLLSVRVRELQRPLLPAGGPEPGLAVHARRAGERHDDLAGPRRQLQRRGLVGGGERRLGQGQEVLRPVHGLEGDEPPWHLPRPRPLGDSRLPIEVRRGGRADPQLHEARARVRGVERAAAASRPNSRGLLGRAGPLQLQRDSGPREARPLGAAGLFLLRDRPPRGRKQVGQQARADPPSVQELAVGGPEAAGVENGEEVRRGGERGRDREPRRVRVEDRGVPHAQGEPQPAHLDAQSHGGGGRGDRLPFRVEKVYPEHVWASKLHREDQHRDAVRPVLHDEGHGRDADRRHGSLHESHDSLAPRRATGQRH
mmetsp:Transcript_8905/g.25423  ORF Transcript_8905/g.25423 Transcript_8905/m.25423 type:complete len:332 (+) Transcript_8905:429-1424(+)